MGLVGWKKFALLLCEPRFSSCRLSCATWFLEHAHFTRPGAMRHVALAHAHSAIISVIASSCINSGRAGMRALAPCVDYI